MSQILNNNPGQPSGRIEYIDALRGFTMLLVVFHHVGSLCWHIKGLGISAHDYLIQVRMPMFFFISGFVLYKAGVVWNTRQVISFFRKKIPVQLISPFIFFIVFLHLRHTPLSEAIVVHDKIGYWFTYVLFIYYVFYAAVRFCIRNKWSGPVLLVLGLMLYHINWPPVYDAIPLPENVMGFLSMQQWRYFLFFVIGTLVREHFPRVEQWLDSKWVLPVCICTYFLINAFSDMITLPSPMFNLTTTLTGLVILFSFFRLNRNSLSKDKVVGHTLQYVGRRTLDVYLIHYFLIPRNLGFITVFTDHPMPIIETTVSLIIAILITAGCLLIGNIIRLSPLLAHWVFGAKYPTKQ